MRLHPDVINKILQLHKQGEIPTTSPSNDILMIRAAVELHLYLKK